MTRQLERNKNQDQGFMNFVKIHKTGYCRTKSRSTHKVDGSQREFYDYLERKEKEAR
jgi:hypothetical protein